MKRFSTLFALALWFILAALGAACAADTIATQTPAAAAAASPASAAVTGFLRDTVFPLVAAAFMGYLSLFLAKLGNKYHIETLTQKNNLVSDLAFQGISLAEEKAAQFVGSRMALNSNDKLSIAIAHVCAVMPKIDSESARRTVESLLAQTPNIGATGATVVGQPAAAATV